MDIRQKVLIIDDSPLTVKILKNMLSDEYQIFTAFFGADGYKIALEKNVDLIILDVVMSPVDGYEICNMLKHNPATKDIPVIFISALGEMEDEKKGLEIGAIDYITKPFSEPIVKIRVKNHLELKQNRDTLSELSLRDGLTGLFNRRYFDTALEKEWNRAMISKENLTIMIADIDKFKLYNDNYGHLEGDECLRLVSRNIKESIPDKSAVVARFGGEEFVCLIPNTNYEEASLIANTVLFNLNKLNIPFTHSTVCNNVTLSIGVGSIIPDEKYILTNFIKSVDDLLYLAKKEGRNQIKAKKF